MSLASTAKMKGSYLKTAGASAGPAQYSRVELRSHMSVESLTPGIGEASLCRTPPHLLFLRLFLISELISGLFSLSYTLCLTLGHLFKECSVGSPIYSGHAELQS